MPRHDDVSWFTLDAFSLTSYLFILFAPVSMNGSRWNTACHHDGPVVAGAPTTTGELIRRGTGVMRRC